MLFKQKPIITILFLLASQFSSSQILDEKIVKIEDVKYDGYETDIITQNECGTDSMIARTFSTSWTYYGSNCQSDLVMDAAVINKKDRLKDSEAKELKYYFTTLHASQNVLDLFEKYKFKKVTLLRNPYGNEFYDKNILYQIKIDTLFNFKISPTYASVTRKQLKNGIAIIERVPNARDILHITDIKIEFINDGHVQKLAILKRNILTRNEIADYLQDDTQFIRVEILTKAGEPLIYVFDIEEAH